MKNRIKNCFLIGSKAFAELFLQTHHSPSLPLLPGANSIISLTMSLAYKHPLSFSFPIYLSPFHVSFHSPCPSITLSSFFNPYSQPLSIAEHLNSFCTPTYCFVVACICHSLLFHPLIFLVSVQFQIHVV